MSHTVLHNRIKLFRYFEKHVSDNPSLYGVQDSIHSSWFGVGEDERLTGYLHNPSPTLRYLFIVLNWDNILEHNKYTKISKLTIDWERLVNNLNSKGYVFDEKV